MWPLRHLIRWFDLPSTTKKGGINIFSFLPTVQNEIAKNKIQMYILNFMRPSRLGAEVNFCWRTTNIEILWRLPSFSEAINSWKYQNLGIGQLSPVQPVSVFDIQMFLKGLTKVWRKTSPEKNMFQNPEWTLSGTFCDCDQVEDDC